MRNRIIAAAFYLACALIIPGCAGSRLERLDDRIGRLEGYRANTTAKIDSMESKLSMRIRALESDATFIDSIVIDQRISSLEQFKADHDKRWPPSGRK